MRKSRFSEEQIAKALRQAGAGTGVDEICPKLGVSQAAGRRLRVGQVLVDARRHAGLAVGTGNIYYDPSVSGWSSQALPPDHQLDV